MTKYLFTAAMTMFLFSTLSDGISGQSTVDKTDQKVKKVATEPNQNIKIVLPLKFKKKPSTIVWENGDFGGPQARTITVKKNGKLTLPDGVVIYIPKGVVVFSSYGTFPRTITISPYISENQDTPSSGIK